MAIASCCKGSAAKKVLPIVLQYLPTMQLKPDHKQSGLI